MVSQHVVWVLLIYLALVLFNVAMMLLVSHLLGHRHKDRATGEPYESGIVSTGSARMRFSVKFYLVATFFLVFDLEAVYIYAWAMAFRKLGWLGYMEMLIFVSVLLVALYYLWRLGALDFGPKETGRLLQDRKETSGHGVVAQ